MKKLIFVIMLVVATFTSCKKDNSVTPDTPKQTSTKDMVVNSSFDWKTSKQITLDVIGLKDVNPSISNVLYVKSSNGDTIYLKELLVMKNNYTLKFVVPTTETKVMIVYGSKTQNIDLLTNTITFDYIVQ